MRFGVSLTPAGFFIPHKTYLLDKEWLQLYTHDYHTELTFEAFHSQVGVKRDIADGCVLQLLRRGGDHQCSITEVAMEFRILLIRATMQWTLRIPIWQLVTLKGTRATHKDDFTSQENAPKPVPSSTNIQLKYG